MFNAPRTLSLKSTAAIPDILGQPALIPVSLKGVETVNDLFTYRLILKTPDDLNHLVEQAANFNLDDFIGHELTVQIELEGMGSFVAGMAGDSGLANVGAGTREISGLVTDAKLLREQGRHVFYELTLQPWLHLATLRKNSKTFQDKTVIEVLDSLLADYTFPVEKRLYDTYPKRDYQNQYNETDYAFLCRLTQEWGISFHFSHSDGAHRLVLADANGAYQPFSSSAYRELKYYPEGTRIDEETIYAFTPARKLVSGTYTARDYDYTRPRADLTSQRSEPRPTAHNDREIYEWHADNYVQPQAGPQQAGNDPLAEGDAVARRRMEMLRSQGHRAQGAGHVRGLVPGCRFKLSRHPQQAANIDYIVLSANLTIEEVAQESQRVGGVANQQYWIDVDFTVHPARGQEYRPERVTPKPVIPGVATALVVGPPDRNLWTDKLGRIKVQFPWDRLGATDQNSSCWIRVSSPWAGNQLGSMYLPRIGQEVTVSFIDGDPDLPLCTGRVHNQSNLPPWSLPDQSALSGIRSRELTAGGGNSVGGRSNHLILDDTEQKIQAQLKSDHQHSQLSLGNITRIDDNAGRKDARGEGFELRTDGHGAIRAKDGLLITTEARGNAQGHIKDMGETVQRLNQAYDQHDNLAGVAQQNQAQDAGGDQSDVADAIKAQNDAIKGSGGEQGSFPELAEPHLVLASPAGIETTTPQSTHIASGKHTALTSGGHLSLSVGQRLLASIRRGMRLFTNFGGIKAMAAQGDIDIKALKDSINMLAKLNITYIANRITITAKEEVAINGGGSYTKWQAGGVETGTSGNWLVHSAGKNVGGPKSIDQAYPVMDIAEAKYAEKFTIVEPTSHLPLANQKYRILFAGGRTVAGITDAQGKTNVAASEIVQDTRVELLRAESNEVWSSFLWTVIKPQSKG
ncbi:rhs element Vgr family protein [Collimonas arenae]|uniref:Rhs element Vgr family protein n=1 Tax=Collimonas arenae TaxID=279058 RepID=A0A127QGI4_9BURK|nr:type VI secretion system Vgr family protein [Collimonas arenae]AMO98825.1 rhs element Vgr family protein [Collimonas arenae]AMP08722.1 rhs element Vgr family protein [Collimonas arenae]